MNQSEIKKRKAGTKADRSKIADVISVSQTIAKPNVMRSGNHHAQQIIKKLTSRPHLEDSDGYYDMINDEIQMIDIVEKYLSKHCP